MTPEVDDRGYFVLKDHVVVGFDFRGATALELADFNGAAVVSGLSLSRTPSQGYRLEIDPCVGLCGFVEAQQLTITLEPGKPEAAS